jgi:hypothetical protein
MFQKKQNTLELQFHYMFQLYSKTTIWELQIKIMRCKTAILNYENWVIICYKTSSIFYCYFLENLNRTVRVFFLL